MEPREVYETIIASSPAGLDETVLGILRARVGRENRILRRELVRNAVGKDYENASADRQVRRSIARLRKLYPVMSSSGDGGYWWAATRDEVLACMAETQSRARELESRARVLQRMAERFGAESLLGGE